MGKQILPYHKKVKGQPILTIWTNLVDLDSQMLFQDLALKFY